MAGESILIVDDNLLNLKLINFLLVSHGYEVRAAVNAEEALALLEIFHPHLILMDIQLPGMDGIELTQKIKSDPKFKGVIIIAITAYAMKGDKEKFIKLGCDGYIEKPIDTRALPGAIAGYLHP